MSTCCQEEEDQKIPGQSIFPSLANNANFVHFEKTPIQHLFSGADPGFGQGGTSASDAKFANLAEWSHVSKMSYLQP